MKKGILYIIATPIGNLSDITLRALTILKQATLIAAEDTRQSRKLLQHYGIKTPLISLHTHNEKERTQLILQHLSAGEDIGYITDAGTPLISDPGSHLVNRVREEGFSITPIPGPCAAIAALSVSGLSAKQFLFEGFLSSKSGRRKQQLELLRTQSATMVFYESPHRLLATILDMIKIFGSDRYAVIARELTKIYETIYGGSLAELHAWLTKNPSQQKGEFVILVAGVEVEDLPYETGLLNNVLKVLMSELPMKQAVLLTAKITKAPKKEIYRKALSLKDLKK